MEELDSRSAEARFVESVARILVAADVEVRAPHFDAWLESQPQKLRHKVRITSWQLRLQSGGVPSIVAVTLPGVFLAATSSMCYKWLPGLFNMGFAQEVANGSLSVFHAGVASTLIGGAALLCLAFYWTVIGREHAPRSL